MSQLAQLDPADNPYRATPATSWDAPSRGGAYLDDESIELQAFVGPNSEYYLRKWGPSLDDPLNGEAGINWVALFFPVYWMGFRRMYGPAVIYTLVSVGLIVAAQLVFVSLLGSANIPGLVTLILTLLVNLVCALYGNAWYLAKAKREIRSAHDQGLNGQYLLSTIAHRGGTSVLACIGVTFLSSIVGAVGGVFAFMLAHGLTMVGN